MNSDSLNLPHNSFNQSSQAGILQSSLAKIAADLQALLQVEQVNVCQLQPDNQVHVVAEAAHGSSLPSLLFSSFPLDYFAPHSSDLLFQSQIGAMVNAESNTLFQIPRSVSDPESYRVVETMKRIPDGARVLQHLTEMRANLYVVVPIFHHEEPWGLLTAYRPDFSLLATRQLEVVQTLASQLSVAIDRDS
ncbi:MAG: GAF domain-containing protein, partial [Cyanobacteria bacterium P01_D01_bin.44]